VIIPLFPLHSVLFPGGRLPMRIFEQRYMDMAKVCLKESSSFGICLIASGEEVARPGRKPATPEAVGTLAHIADWDMPQLGVLNIVAQGGDRFPPAAPLGRALRPAARRGRTDRRARRAADSRRLCAPGAAAARHRRRPGGGAPNAPAKPHRFFDAGWLGMRYAEVLPIPLAAKQKLLEIEDSIDRLEIIYRFLEGKGLLPEADEALRGCAAPAPAVRRSR
jgi:Lon protease-like protein